MEQKLRADRVWADRVWHWLKLHNAEGSVTIYQLSCLICSYAPCFTTGVRKVDGLDCLKPSVPAFSVKPGQQGRSSPARVRSFRRWQKHLIEVLTLSIPTRNVIVSSTTWDILFGCCADGITEVLVCPVHIRCIRWQQALSELVGQGIVMAPFGPDRRCFHVARAVIKSV